MNCPRCGAHNAAGRRACAACGAPLGTGRVRTPRPADLPPTTVPPPPPSTTTVAAVAVGRAAAGFVRFLRRIPPRLRLFLAAAVVATVVLACGANWLYQRLAYPPEQPVEAFAGALAAGRLEEAAHLAGCTSVLCGGAALRQAYEAPTAIRVGPVRDRHPGDQAEAESDTRYVDLRYRLGGQERQAVVEVHREPGLLRRPWRVVAGATGHLDVVSATLTTARVGGVGVPVRAATGTGRRLPEALIGTYAVRPPDDDPFFTAQPATAAVTGGLGRDETVVVQLETSIRPEVAAAVTAQVKGRLDECAAVADFAPRIDRVRCPFAYEKVIFKPGNPTWHVDAYPQFELRRSDRTTVDGGPIVVRTTVPGKATLTYTADGAPQTVSVDVEVGGAVTVDGAGKIAWTG
jgi:hypothetical protein